MRTDWMPTTPSGKIEMVRVWINVLNERAAAWGVPIGVVEQLDLVTAEAENAQSLATSSTATTVDRRHRDRIIGMLETLMRDVKRRYFLSPPLVDEDYPRLLLKAHDTNPTPVPPPTGIASVRVELTVRGQLTFNWEPDGEQEDERAVHGIRIHYGVVAADPSAQSALTGKHYYLAAPPVTPDQLKEDEFSVRRSIRVDFPYEDSGHVCWACSRIENSKGDRGPWGAMIHAVIP